MTRTDEELADTEAGTVRGLYKYVSIERDRHGKQRIYFRRRGRPRYRVRCELGSPEFEQLLRAYASDQLTTEQHYRPAYVYCMGTVAGPYKIGVSTNPANRLAALRTGSATRPYLILAFEAITAKQAYRIEKAVHRSLAKSRVSGEWFREKIDAIESCIVAAGISMGIDLRPRHFI